MAGRDRENIRIEDDVLGRKTRRPWSRCHRRARTNLDLAFARIRPGPFSSNAITTTAAPMGRATTFALRDKFYRTPPFHRHGIDDRLGLARILGPLSMTGNFDESIITGTREMSGSAATRFQKTRPSPFSESSRPSSMFDVDDLRAPSQT